MLLSYKPLHLEAQQCLQEEGCVVDINVYLTWELETEQRFTCLQYPEERRVVAVVCQFTSFSSVWWSEHC